MSAEHDLPGEEEEQLGRAHRRRRRRVSALVQTRVAIFREELT
jgi:hypothetical protein